MSALTRFFFRNPYQIEPLSNVATLLWWESRRPVFNIAVGAAGIASLAFIWTGTLVTSGSALPFPLVPVLLYGAAANLFYSLGPAVDILIQRVWGREYAAVGPALFRYGFVFSVGVTLLPIPAFAMDRLLWLAGVFTAL